MSTKVPPTSEQEEREIWEEEYEEISRRISKEELHEQIAQRGLEVLDRGVPYVVQAARWRRIDAARRGSRERPFDSEPIDAGQIMSPFQAAVASEERRMLVDALATFPDADVLAVWRHAEGVSDEEIAAAIEALGNRRISPAGVRKRRERAMERLRKMLETQQ